MKTLYLCLLREGVKGRIKTQKSWGSGVEFHAEEKASTKKWFIQLLRSYLSGLQGGTITTL